MISSSLRDQRKEDSVPEGGCVLLMSVVNESSQCCSNELLFFGRDSSSRTLIESPPSRPCSTNADSKTWRPKIRVEGNIEGCPAGVGVRRENPSERDIVFLNEGNRMGSHRAVKERKRMHELAESSFFCGGAARMGCCQIALGAG